MLSNNKLSQLGQNTDSNDFVSKPSLNDRLAHELNQKLSITAKQVGDIVDSGLDTPQKRAVIKSKVKKACQLINEDLGGAYLNMMYDYCIKMQNEKTTANTQRENELICELGKYQNYLYIKHLENKRST